MNPQQSGGRTRGEDLRTLETELLGVSRRIDRTLRRHYATQGMRRLLKPPRHWREQGRRVAMSAPSLWLVLTCVLLVAIAIASASQTAWLPQFLTQRLPALPRIPLWWVVAAIAALVAVERWLLPRLALTRHRFRLMRLEHTEGDPGFPFVYVSARTPGSPTGFALQAWKGMRGIEPGDIVIAISDAHDRGLAVIPLRTVGRLPIIVWDRDLLQHDAFPPLPKDVRALAEDFDRGCDLNAKHAGRIERSRTLRSGQTEPQAVANPQQAWAKVALAPAVKTRLISLAAHFAAGSASATRGLLLYGPPGTGKTTIARTFADSMGCAFFPLSLTDLKSGFIGQSGENVKALWSKARAEPRAVIFVDECEGVFGRRGGVNTDSFVEEIVTAFLAQWDGFEKQTHVWVVGATNRRDLIDPALLSRFEDQLEIGLPDGHQRLEILAGEFARLSIPPPLPAQTEALTAGMSGRDLVSLSRRVAREHGTKQPLSDDTLAAMTAAMRKQGSTATDAGARWDTLILADETLKELKTTAGLLQHADTFRKRGIGVPRGLLLYGPPGTGKTQIARTLANETGLRFIAASTADIKQGFLGQSGQKVRELFERARESAPSLLFIDEIDIVAAARGGQNDSILTEIVGQLLQEMDGIAAQTQPVFVLAATNRRDQIDAAVLSRLPKQIEIPLPDRDGIVKLLQVMLRDKPLAFDIATGAETLAVRADGKSGRDLRSWVESAEHRAVARAIDAGDPEAIAIELGDFG
ncbi:ATP-binding protein [Lysobacter hankyongensis]|uniref:AAA+ ATPase domain-containing protein n=1 Tax=Lysobacter hankyongensis TaxID=1176535 RepID=A0ABP9CC65_9GAMM